VTWSLDLDACQAGLMLKTKPTAEAKLVAISTVPISKTTSKSISQQL
jgi:hypothetical protein